MRRALSYQLVMAALIVGALAAFAVHYHLAAQPVGPAMDGQVREVVCE